MLKRLRTITLVFVAFIVLVATANFLASKISCGKLTILPQGSTPLINTAAQFSTMPPQAALPDEQKCASLVHRSTWEPRPDNTQANQRVPTQQQIAALSPWGPAIDLDAKADTFRTRITGNFTGTTDEIIQWIACKWGFDVNIVRAQALTESEWHQSYRGDLTTERNLCPPGTWNNTACYQSYGMLQIKYVYNVSAWPMSRDDTAFNLDYAYAHARSCYEGWTNYFYGRSPSPDYPRYQAGDLWGCIGSWYSGGWYDQAAINYINTVKMNLRDEAWLKQGFVGRAC